MMGKAWWQEYEAWVTLHLQSGSRGEGNAGAQLASPFPSLWDQTPEMAPLRIQDGSSW